MVVLRCTERLRKRIKAPIATASPTSTTRLGDWSANLVHIGRQQLVIAVSERTFLPVVVEAAPAETLVPRLQASMALVLLAVGVTPQDVADECANAREVVLAKTNNRQAVGLLVDFGSLAQAFIEEGAPLLLLSLRLAGVPCSPLRFPQSTPDRATRALFRRTAINDMV